MDVTCIGIDLAKQVFQIHGVDHHGKAVVKKQLRRGQMLSYFRKLAPTLIGMEACGSAHYWARQPGLLAKREVSIYAISEAHCTA